VFSNQRIAVVIFLYETFSIRPALEPRCISVIVFCVGPYWCACCKIWLVQADCEFYILNISYMLVITLFLASASLAPLFTFLY